MNKIREKIQEVLGNGELNTIELESNAIMEIIEEYLEQAFDAAKEERHLGCGDYEDMYWDWKVWYDEEVNVK